MSGLLLTACFPKPALSWLAWVALVPLFFAVCDAAGKSRFRLGLLAGCAHYFTLIYWLVPTLRIYGELPLVVAVLLFLLLAIYLALYVGLFTFIITGIRGKGIGGVFAAPFVWVGLEYLQTFLLSGFPWELLGYSQYMRLPLIQLADITGVYGVSFLIVLVNAVIFSVLMWAMKLSWHSVHPKGRQVVYAGLVTLALMGGAWGYGKWRLGMIDRYLTDVPTRKVALVQGNIDQNKKWEDSFKQETVTKYLELCQSAFKETPDLVILPETAMPFFFRYEQDLTAMIQRQARQMGVYLLTGAPSFERDGDTLAFFNSAYLVGPDGKVEDRYDKIHLVPFGEYIPMGQWFPFIEKIVFGSGDFSPGTEGRLVQMGNWYLGVQICYEIIFPGSARLMTRNGASVIVNITNDAWYGRTSAPWQHFSMTVFRAVENRRSLVRSANTGISGFVWPSGRIRSTTPLFEEAVVTSDVPACLLTSVYTRVGNVFAILCLMIMVFVLWRRYRYNTT